MIRLAQSPIHSSPVLRHGAIESPNPPLHPIKIKTENKKSIQKNEKYPISRLWIVNSTQLHSTSLDSTSPLSKSPFSLSSSMASATTAASEAKRDVYSVWALPPEELTPRLKKLMDGLRSEFGGPQFEPHVTVVGAILTESEARDKFNKACEQLKSYTATVEKVATGTFYYQCVYLLLRPSPEVVEASAHCCSHFGYQNAAPYMPHLSLLYGDLTDEEKKAAQDKAYALDDSIGLLNFPISRLALYQTDTEDRSCKSWEKVAECQLKP